MDHRYAHLPDDDGCSVSWVTFFHGVKCRSTVLLLSLACSVRSRSLVSICKHGCLGAGAVGQPALNRFFSLHYLLPFIIAGLVIVHIWAFHSTGNNNPTGVEVRRGSVAEAQERHAAFLAILRDQRPLCTGDYPDSCSWQSLASCQTTLVTQTTTHLRTRL